MANGRNCSDVRWPPSHPVVLSVDVQYRRKTTFAHVFMLPVAPSWKNLSCSGIVRINNQPQTITVNHGTLEEEAGLAATGMHDNRQNCFRFQFHHVLHNAGQDTIYDGLARDVVQGAVDGISGEKITACRRLSFAQCEGFACSSLFVPHAKKNGNRFLTPPHLQRLKHFVGRVRYLYSSTRCERFAPFHAPALVRAHES